MKRIAFYSDGSLLCYFDVSSIEAFIFEPSFDKLKKLNKVTISDILGD